ncbi:NAD(P)/FAD-dependent oxidoreductase [Paenarthrobacter sp. Z7-10]|uniref:dihydrolipoyl dehydrogenase family protein n=1 Tax=Paenarthrobacter sp. Z7-10 TaxID=2787635 RepID=UPI0022A8EF08|nr:NAD(P)/FAD-dependent oxidoreductase [Paenarthrobacter sp. Z7-10]MCZ2402525.1 NAD(P)/FAD-dependent oxidoreductase [Paenarthrobacter sp. Z7-10]
MAAGNKIIDLLVVGGGTAGIVGAKTAAGFGAGTVLVERSRTGGDCLWTGCVPSKTLLAVAEHARTMRAVTGQPPAFNAVQKRISAAINTIEPVDSPAALDDAGVRVIKGNLTFRAHGVAEVNGRTIHFRQALIATGAAPAALHVPGLAPGVTFTSETIWELDTLPARLAIIGGGPIACELGQAFAQLGSVVTMIARSRILGKEEPDAAALVRVSLKYDGVAILENTTIADAVGTDAGCRLRLRDGKVVDADAVLLATGRTPRTAGLGLQRVAVTVNRAGHVVTDKRMRTSNPLIWAAGDVTANPQFTHLAGVHASVAASNAVLGLRRQVSATVPRVTFTSPELAAVGLTTANDGPKHRSRMISHIHVDRAVTEDNTVGFTRLIVDRRGKILGGTIVGPRAGESLAELTLAVQNGMTTSDLAATTHPYPTYSDGVWNAALADVRGRLASPVARLAMTMLVWFRRRRLDTRSPHRSDR